MDTRGGIWRKIVSMMIMLTMITAYSIPAFADSKVADSNVIGSNAAGLNTENLNNDEDYELPKDSIEFLTWCAKEKGILLEGLTEEDIPEIKKHIDQYYDKKKQCLPKANFDIDTMTNEEYENYFNYYHEYGYIDSLKCHIEQQLEKSRQKTLKLTK